MSKEWNTMQELNELAGDQKKLVDKFVPIEKTTNICSIFITLFDITEDNVKENFQMLKILDIDSITKKFNISFSDCFRYGLLAGIIHDLK